MFGFGEKSNLNYDDMDDLRRQGVAVDLQKTTLPPRKSQMRYNNRNIIKFGDYNESFSRGNQNIYTTPMRISKIIIVRR